MYYNDNNNDSGDKNSTEANVRMLHANASTLNASIVHGGSYMSAHVLLNLFNKLRKRDKMRGLPGILIAFSQIV